MHTTRPRNNLELRQKNRSFEICIWCAPMHWNVRTRLDLRWLLENKELMLQWNRAQDLDKYFAEKWNFCPVFNSRPSESM